MESNHHKQIQSLPHYHYANPQLLKMERVVRFELTTSSLENSYSTNWVTHAKNGGWGKIRTFGGFHLGALAKLCIRPLCHPTVKSLTNSDFFKRRYYQSSVPLSSGVVLKWRLMSVLPGPSSFNELSFQDWCSQLISAYQPYKIGSHRGIRTHTIYFLRVASPSSWTMWPLKWSATSELNWLHMNPNHVCYRNTCDRLKW